VIRAHKGGDWSITDDGVVVGGHHLEAGEYSVELVADDDRPSTGLAGRAGVVVLDLELTAELESEGTSRDLIRLIQQARRAAGLDVSDRIRLDIVGAQRWIDAARTHDQLVRAETLATEVGLQLDAGADDSTEPSIAVERAAPS
jgi:isoleucyl-tRNA synthetase